MPGLEGTRLGRYLLRQRLGRGGMSEVYLATDEGMHRDVAIKVVSDSHTDYVERFQREIESIGNLQHDHILPAYDFGEQPPWYYMVMPYIDYCTLLDKLRESPLPLDYAGELLAQIASALQYAHDHGVIHRDIKPSNILMRDDHYLYLADFGLAKPVVGADKLTQTGVLMGTPEYMAPELADGPPGKSSDIYALGILLYQMVTGELPFTGDIPLAVFLKQMHEQPLPPSRLRPGLPRSIDLVILRALEKDPRRRYDSPMALATAYMDALLYSNQSTPEIPVRPQLSTPVVPVDEPMPIEDVHIAQPPQPAPVARQPEKLVLPAYDPPQPQLPYRRPASATPGPAAPPRRASARSPRIGPLGLITLIALAIAIAVVGIGIAAFENQGSKGGSNPATTTTARTAPPAQPSPGASLTAQALATAQAIYSQATAVTGKTALFMDPLDGSSSNPWPQNPACVFRNSAYHVLTSQPGALQPCTLGGNHIFDNCAIKVDVTLLQGNDAGFIFRFDSGSGHFYDFEINDQGQYYFRRHDADYVPLIPSTSSSAIRSGTNALMVIANGSDFRLFINGVFVHEAQDSTYSSGQLSLVSGTLETASSADASFANLAVYPLA